MATFVENIPGVRRVFYGWWIVAVGITIAILNGAFYTYGFGVYYVPLLHELGASRAALGGVVGLARLEGGLIAPLAGWLIDKYGPRRLLYFGIITMGFAFFFLSWITSLWMLYAVFMLIATASSFGGGRPINVAVANWFVRKRARALGILLAGIGLGGSAVVIVGWLTETYGWRTAAVIAGLAYWIIGIPLVSLVHSWSPADSVGLGQALWRNDPARRGPAGASTGRGQENLSAEFAWGFDTFGALSVPWARMGASGAGRELRVGYSLLTGRGIPSLEFGESAFGREYALGWEFSLRCRIQVAVRMTHGTGLPGDRSDTGLRIGFRSIMPRRASGGSPGGASCGMAQPLFQSGASSLGPALP